MKDASSKATVTFVRRKYKYKYVFSPSNCFLTFKWNILSVGSISYHIVITLSPGSDWRKTTNGEILLDICDYISKAIKSTALWIKHIFS